MLKNNQGKRFTYLITGINLILSLLFLYTQGIYHVSDGYYEYVLVISKLIFEFSFDGVIFSTIQSTVKLRIFYPFLVSILSFILRSISFSGILITTASALFIGYRLFHFVNSQEIFDNKDSSIKFIILILSSSSFVVYFFKFSPDFLFTLLIFEIIRKLEYGNCKKRDLIILSILAILTREIGVLMLLYVLFSMYLKNINWNYKKLIGISIGIFIAILIGYFFYLVLFVELLQDSFMVGTYFAKEIYSEKGFRYYNWSSIPYLYFLIFRFAFSIRTLIQAILLSIFLFGILIPFVIYQLYKKNNVILDGLKVDDSQIWKFLWVGIFIVIHFLLIGYAVTERYLLIIPLILFINLIKYRKDMILLISENIDRLLIGNVIITSIRLIFSLIGITELHLIFPF